MKCLYCNNSATRNHARHDSQELKLENLCEYHYSQQHPEMSKFNFKKAKTCHICKTITDKPIEHHVCYFPQKIIYVCFGCHKKIHRGTYPELIPNRRMMLIFYAKKKWLKFGLHRTIPINHIDKKRHDGMVFAFGRPLTTKEQELRKEMRKTKEVVQ